MLPITFYVKLAGDGPAFRRSFWGYNTHDVNRFLKETSAERDRLEDALVRVETLIAEWQCGPEAILAAAHREAAEIRANAEREARRASNRAEGRQQVISLNASARDLAPTAESGLRTFQEPLPSETGSSGSPVEATKPLLRIRTDRRRRTRRIAGLVAACAAAVIVVSFEFAQPGSPISNGGSAHAAAGRTPARGQGTPHSSTEPGKASPAPAKSLLFTISAVKPCWIRTVVDGAQQMERLLQPQETIMLHATNEVVLKVGDAAAVSLLINNRPIKPLGRSGEVVTRVITRANYSSLIQPES